MAFAGNGDKKRARSACLRWILASGFRAYLYLCAEKTCGREPGGNSFRYRGTAGDMISRLLGCAAGYCVTETDTPSVLAVTIPLKVR